MLVVGGILLPWWSGNMTLMITALAISIAGEGAGRFLFFAAAIPRHMTAPYLAADREAA
jgi:hypothetical protein